MQLHALTAIQQRQQYAIVIRNVLASNQHTVEKEATYIPLICYENSLWTKKLPAIFGGVVGRSSRLPYAQQGLGSNLQHQMVAAKSIQSGPVRPALKGAPMDILYHSEIGTPHTMIEVMNHIKVQLKPTGRPEYSGSQDDECVTAMNSTTTVYLLVKSCAGFTLQTNLTKHQQRRGLRPGSIIDIITIEATLMSLLF